MSFTSVTYFLFVGISLLIYTIVPKRAKWCVLLGASAVYYVMAAGLRTLWLVAAILIVYGGGLLLGNTVLKNPLVGGALAGPAQGSCRQRGKETNSQKI